MAERETDERLTRLWLHFLWSLALADHLGDASEAARSFAGRMGLPIPPDDAGFDEWLDWLRDQHGIDGGIHSDQAKGVQ